MRARGGGRSPAPDELDYRSGGAASPDDIDAYLAAHGESVAPAPTPPGSAPPGSAPPGADLAGDAARPPPPAPAAARYVGGQEL